MPPTLTRAIRRARSGFRKGYGQSSQMRQTESASKPAPLAPVLLCTFGVVLIFVLILMLCAAIVYRGAYRDLEIPGLIVVGVLGLIIWRAQRRKDAEKIGSWPRFLMVFAALFVSLDSWTQGNLSDIGGTLARSLVLVTVPFSIAYLARGRKSRRDWNSFARWFFWLALILAAGAFAATHQPG